uniref:hypothetical protein n=1 Tax=Sphingomonas bacterium TaxID=1895847 RepID=UPI002614D88A|nr:hypothetical protein [Sphingomonas bacterium]
MILFVLALLQAAPAPAPEPAPIYVVAELPDGGFSYTVDKLPAADLDSVQAELDREAAKRCDRMVMDAEEQSYDQATDSNGEASAEITHLKATYRCAAAPAKATGN